MFTLSDNNEVRQVDQSEPSTNQYTLDTSLNQQRIYNRGAVQGFINTVYRSNDSTSTITYGTDYASSYDDNSVSSFSYMKYNSPNSNDSTNHYTVTSTISYNNIDNHYYDKNEHGNVILDEYRTLINGKDPEKQTTRMNQSGIKELDDIINDYISNPIDYITKFFISYILGNRITRTIQRFNTNVINYIESRSDYNKMYHYYMDKLSDNESKKELRMSLLQINDTRYRLGRFRFIRNNFFSLLSYFHANQDVDNTHRGASNTKASSYPNLITEASLSNSSSDSFCITFGFESNFSNDSYSRHRLEEYDILDRYVLSHYCKVYIDNLDTWVNGHRLTYQSIRIVAPINTLNDLHTTIKQIIIQYDPYHLIENNNVFKNVGCIHDSYLYNEGKSSLNNIVIIDHDTPILDNDTVRLINNIKKASLNYKQYDKASFIDVTDNDYDNSDWNISYYSNIDTLDITTQYIHQILFKHILDILSKHYIVNDINHKSFVDYHKDTLIESYQVVNNGNYNRNTKQTITKRIEGIDFSILDIAYKYYIDNYMSKVIEPFYIQRNQDN